MALVVISINRDELPAHTNEEFEAWVKYEVGHNGGISLENPLCDESLDGYVREISY